MAKATRSHGLSSLEVKVRSIAMAARKSLAGRLKYSIHLKVSSFIAESAPPESVAQRPSCSNQPGG